MAWWLPFGSVPEISADELLARLETTAPPLLLDVRSATEWRRSRIQGAINIPITQLRHRLGELEQHRNRDIVAICLSAHRSIPAVRLLREAGFRDPRQLAGGMRSWWAKQYPVARG